MDNPDENNNGPPVDMEGQDPDMGEGEEGEDGAGEEGGDGEEYDQYFDDQADIGYLPADHVSVLMK